LSTPKQVSSEETQQLLRTVEMFEAITQAEPGDYQSLEILKEAYAKLDRKDDTLAISLKLADAYEKQGQVFKAILECEGILQDYPQHPEISRRLEELEAQAKSAVSASPQAPQPEPEPVLAPVPVTKSPLMPAVPQTVIQQAEDGDRMLLEVMVAEKLAKADALQPLLAKLKTMRSTPQTERKTPLSLAQLAVNEELVKLEDVLAVMLNKSALPYIPLANYDTERDIACLLPLDLCWQFCLVPFDQISRCVLVATANPFLPAARRAVEAALRLNLFWYVAAPSEIALTLRRAHRLEAATKPTVAAS